MTSLVSSLDQRIRALCTPRHLIGASIFRVLAGANVLCAYLVNYAQRHYLYGPQGAFASGPSRDGDWLNLYAHSQSPLYFEGLYHAGIVLAFLWMLGFETWLLTPLTFLTWRALVSQGALVWDGGDNMMQILFVYASFMQLSTRFAPFARESRDVEGLFSRLRGLVHNGALLAVVLQLCVVYSVSGLTKVQGETWRNGTALYYALRSNEFGALSLGSWLYRSDIVLTLVCYVTVFFLVAFPFLVFLNPWTRRLAVIMGISFHVGIGVVMGLVSFATYMIAAELMVVSDDEYRALRRHAQRLVQWVSPRARAANASTASQEA